MTTVLLNEIVPELPSNGLFIPIPSSFPPIGCWIFAAICKQQSTLISQPERADLGNSDQEHRTEKCVLYPSAMLDDHVEKR